MDHIWTDVATVAVSRVPRAYNPRSDGPEISASDKPAAFLLAGHSRLVLIDRGEDNPFLSLASLSRHIQRPKGESLSRLRRDRSASSAVRLEFRFFPSSGRTNKQTSL